MSSTTLRTVLKSGISSRPLQLLLSFLLFFLTRIVFIVQYPVFNDEAIYMRYGKIMIDTVQKFYSMAVIGKQPLLYWLYALSGSVLYDPLIGARLISLVIGILSFFGIYKMTLQLADHRTAILATLLYTATPMFLLFDGLAVVDGAIVCLVIWVLVLSLSLIAKFGWWKIVLLGTLLGISFWIKSTGLLLAPVMVWGLIAARMQQSTDTQRALVSVFIIYFLAFLLVAPLIVRPEFAAVLRYQRDYALTIGEIVAFPISHWVSNIGNILVVLIGYLLPFTPVFAIVTIVKKYRTVHVKYLVWSFLLLVVPLIVTARGIQMRYIVFSAVPLLPLAALAVRKYFALGVIALAFMLIASVILAVNSPLFFRLYPQRSVYAGEHWQYVKGWPSGYGVMDALAFVDKERNGRSIFVGVRWDSGNPEDTILLYAARIPGISTMFFDPLMEDFPALVQKYRSLPMYFITRNHQTAGLDEYLHLLHEFRKPNSQESVNVYRINL